MWCGNLSPHNWIHATGGADYLYDAAGNMTFNATPPTQNYSYDQENRLTGAAGYAYTYDGDGNRVRKSSSSTGTLYWYMTPGIVGESDLSGNLTDEYIFFDGERVARKSTNGVFYYFSDHLKTASVVTDSAGTIKAESDYYPWGGELQFVANDSNHYKFTGKERDNETQLDYFGARYYSNGLGRWVSADWSPTPIPVPYADFSDPQSLNLYGYVRGLPTAKADLDGHNWWDDLKQSHQERIEAAAAERSANTAYVQKVIDSHPMLKAWDQFTQKVDNALNGHGWKTDAQAAAADAASRADWAKTSRGMPYPEMKIGIVAPVGLGAIEEGAIYRAGAKNPGNITGEDLSFRDSLSNPIESKSNPVFKPGKEWFSTDVAKLPEGAAVRDGGTGGLPEGHVTVNATAQEIKNASEGMPKGKFPKGDQ